MAANRIVRPISIGFFFSAGFFFVVGSGMTLFPPAVSAILGIVCLFIGVVLLVLWYGGDREDKDDSKPSSGKPHIGVNFTIDSRDFITRDIEYTKAFFDGVEKIIKATKKPDKSK